MTETPPQSGSGRKEQPKSKAAPSIAGSILHSACSRPIVRLPMAGLRGCAPLARFLTAFSRKKAVSPKADAFVPPPQSDSSYQYRSSG